MCLGPKAPKAPKIPAPEPTPPPPPPPEPTPIAPTISSELKQSSEAATKQKGRKALRIDIGVPGTGSGANIPGAK